MQVGISNFQYNKDCFFSNYFLITAICIHVYYVNILYKHILNKCNPEKVFFFNILLVACPILIPAAPMVRPLCNGGFAPSPNPAVAVCVVPPSPNPWADGCVVPPSPNPVDACWVPPSPAVGWLIAPPRLKPGFACAIPPNVGPVVVLANPPRVKPVAGWVGAPNDNPVAGAEVVAPSNVVCPNDTPVI